MRAGGGGPRRLIGSKAIDVRVGDDACRATGPPPDNAGTLVDGANPKRR